MFLSVRKMRGGVHEGTTSNIDSPAEHTEMFGSMSLTRITAFDDKQLRQYST